MEYWEVVCGRCSIGRWFEAGGVLGGGLWQVEYWGWFL